MTETMLQFYLMPIQPFLICTVCATLWTSGSNNVSFLSAAMDTRIPDQEGQPYLCVITRIPGDTLQLTRAKQPRVMIEGRVARLQPSG